MPSATGWVWSRCARVASCGPAGSSADSTRSPRPCATTAAPRRRFTSAPGARSGGAPSVPCSRTRRCAPCPRWRTWLAPFSPPTAPLASPRGGGARLPSRARRARGRWCSPSPRSMPRAPAQPTSLRPGSRPCVSARRPRSPSRTNGRPSSARRERSMRSRASDPTRCACWWRSPRSCLPEPTCEGCGCPAVTGRSTGTPRTRRGSWRSSAAYRNSRTFPSSPRRIASRWATGPMRPLRSLSDTLRRLKPRERRVIAGGAIVSAVALVIVLGVVPFAHRWAAREATYAASREQWMRLATLATSRDRLRRALDEHQRAFAADEARLVSGATPALAASMLQGLLQRYADESAVQLDRVDVAGQPRPDKPGLLAIPVQLQGQGDIYGLVDFLHPLPLGGNTPPVGTVARKA